MEELYKALGLDAGALGSGDLPVHSPTDGAPIAEVRTDSAARQEDKIAAADAAFAQWKRRPRPQEG